VVWWCGGVEERERESMYLARFPRASFCPYTHPTVVGNYKTQVAAKLHIGRPTVWCDMGTRFDSRKIYIT